MNHEPILKATGLKVTRGGKDLIQVAELNINRGEFLAVTGPNGAGKSTLLKALAFLEKADGDICFNGQEVGTRQERLKARRRIAMVFQDPLLLRGSVIDNVEMGLKLRGVDRATRKEKALYWLDKLKIIHLVERDVNTLSGGEAQRVSIARAMVLQPDVLFLDEPFTYLDTPTKATLISELKELLIETGTTTLMITHDLSDIPFLADRMMIILDGKIEQIGPVEHVLTNPNSIKAAQFIGMENIWEGRVQLVGNGLTFTSRDNDHVVLQVSERVDQRQVSDKSDAIACIRPEHVIVATEQLVDEPNSFKARVEGVYPYGYFYRLKLDANIPITAMLVAAQVRFLPKIGEEITLTIPRAKTFLILADN